MKNLWGDKEQEEKRRYIIYILMGIILAVQLASIIYAFQFKKEGYHSDEIWSYGYANSYYLKDIYQDNEGNPSNVNEWKDGKVLRDYIVVNEGEGFSYGSIYQNQIYDLSPPLHSMVLHTICSFFPEQYSRWFSFTINIAFFLISMIFLFKICRLLKDDFFAICCCSLYGFSLAARDTYIYLRMYAMCTALVMIILYHIIIYLKKLKETGKVFHSNLIWICLVSFAGFLTHYYMISFMGILTFFLCLFLLCKKRIKAMFVYGFSMLTTLILSLLAFPSLFTVVENQNSKISGEAAQSMNFNFIMRFKILFNFITKKIFNIFISVYHTINIQLIIVYVVLFLFFLIPILFLFRNTKVVKKFIQRIKFIGRNFKSIFRYLCRRIRWIYFVFLITIIGQIIVVGENSNVYGMGQYLDRYIMFLYPIASIIGSAFLFLLVRVIFRKRKIYQSVFALLMVGLVVINLYNREIESGYLFLENREGEGIEKVVQDKDCIYIMNSSWILTAVVPYLMEADEFFRVDSVSYNKYEKEYKKHINKEPLILMIDTSFKGSVYEAISNENMKISSDQKDEMNKDEQKYEEILTYFENLEPTTKMEKLTSEDVFGRTMEAYIINP